MASSSEIRLEEQAVELQTTLLGAMLREDRDAWDRRVAPDCLGFEQGKQDGSGDVFELVAVARKEGYKMAWSVTEPRVAYDRELLLMSYVNVGGIAKAHAG